MGFLDAYDTFVNNKCQELSLQNSTFDKLTKSLGISNLVGGIQDLLSKGLVESLKNSPLRDLAEDILAQAITNNARRLSQNILNQVPSKLTGTLTDIRATVFNAVFSTMTLQSDMMLYFASVIAGQAVDAIKDKRRTLIALQESVRKLHNALLVLAGGGPFFNDYLARLRMALVKIDDADKQLALVESAFGTQTIFPRPNFNKATQLLEEAYQLIMPPVRGREASELNEGFLKNVFQEPEYGQQLAMLMAIPKLTKEMLSNYDLYAVKVLKVNALLLGFQTCIQNIKQVTGGQFKDLILTHIKDSRTFLADLMNSMALQLNGLETARGGPVRVPVGESGQTTFFRPNPTKTSSRAIEWGVKVKMAQGQLALIDPDSLVGLTASSQGVREYELALQRLAALDDRKMQTAVLRATDGREQPGDLEPDFITLAFQANQCIVDSTLLPGAHRSFDSRNVLALGQKVNSRIQLSIDQDREVELILLRFITKVEPLIQNIRRLGDSLFKMMDDLGMDRASDFLKRGAFGEFFSMNGKTATYVGAAIAGLNAIQSLLSTQEQRQCIVESINRIQVEETSKKLSAQRAVSTNFVKQQKQNENFCAALKRDQAKTEGCAQALEGLKDNPLKSLSGMFRGVFGGDIFDSLESTGALGGLSSAASSLGIPVGGAMPAEGISAFNSIEQAKIAAEDAAKAAKDVTDGAVSEAKGVLEKAGIKVDEGEGLDSIQEKLNYVKEASGNPDLVDAANEASTSANLAKYMQSDAFAAEKALTTANGPFQKFGG